MVVWIIPRYQGVQSLTNVHSSRVVVTLYADYITFIVLRLVCLLQPLRLVLARLFPMTRSLKIIGLKIFLFHSCE